jgi:hypothetical protein
MPIVPLDSLEFFPGLAQTINPYQANTRPVYGMLGHLPVHFIEQHAASQNDKV